MDRKEIAQIIYQLVKRDCSNFKGRLFLKDLREALDLPELTRLDVLKIWREAYPNIPITEPTDNLFIIDLIEGNERFVEPFTYMINTFGSGE